MVTSHGHYIRRCICGVLIGQCRCPASNKRTEVVKVCTHAKGPLEAAEKPVDHPVTLTVHDALADPTGAPFATHPCRCVKNHTPACSRTHIHHIWPKGMGGPNTDENKIPLCPTTHSEVHVVLEAFQRAGTRLERRRPWGMYAYLLAVRGWEMMEAAKTDA